MVADKEMASEAAVERSVSAARRLSATLFHRRSSASPLALRLRDGAHPPVRRRSRPQ
jgi:hypothetical protein